MNKELEEKLGKLSKDELEEYHNAVDGTQRAVDVFGIGIILFVLLYTSYVTVGIGFISVYFLSNLSVAMSQTKQYIRTRLENR